MDDVRELFECSEGVEKALYAIALALSDVAVHLKYLGVGDAASTMGAVEFLAVEIKEGLKAVAGAVSEVANELTEPEP